jgi:hypothetical protein
MKIITHSPGKRKLVLATTPKFTPAQMAALVKGAQKHLADTLVPADPTHTSWLDEPLATRKP